MRSPSLQLHHTGGPADYLTRTGHRYNLNPDALDVDLWRLRDALRTAEHATNPTDRAAAWRAAVHAYRGDLAHGKHYEWIEPYREAVRQQILDATLALADTLTDQPADRLTLVTAALRHSPYSEPLYQAAMRANADLGHPDAIHALRRDMTRRLTEIDAEPTDDTLTLADQLLTRAQTHTRRTTAHRTAPPDQPAAHVQRPDTPTAA